MYFSTGNTMRKCLVFVCLTLSYSLAKEITREKAKCSLEDLQKYAKSHSISEHTINFLPTEIHHESRQGGFVSKEIESNTPTHHSKSKHEVFSKNSHTEPQQRNSVLKTHLGSNEKHSIEKGKKKTKSQGQSNIISDLTHKVEETVSSVKNHAKDLAQKFGEKVNKTEENVKNFINDVKTHGGGKIVNDLTNKVKNTISSVKNGTEELTHKIGEKIKPVEQKAEGIIKEFETQGGGKIINDVTNEAEKVISSVKNRTNDVAHKIGEEVKSAEQKLKGFIKGVEGKAHENVDHLKEELSSGASHLAHNIEGTVSKVENGVGNLISEISKNVKDKKHNQSTENSEKCPCNNSQQSNKRYKLENHEKNNYLPNIASIGTRTKRQTSFSQLSADGNQVEPVSGRLITGRNGCRYGETRIGNVCYQNTAGSRSSTTEPRGIIDKTKNLVHEFVSDVKSILPIELPI